MLIPTSQNAAVLFLDLQEEIVKNSRTVSLERLRRSAGALAKLAALHDLPRFLSAVPPGGDFLDVVLSPLAGDQPRLRTQTTAFSDAGLVFSQSGNSWFMSGCCLCKMSLRKKSSSPAQAIEDDRCSITAAR